MLFKKKEMKVMKKLKLLACAVTLISFQVHAEIDTGVGKYLYPLGSGGTDELAESFWTQNKKVEGQFSVHVELRLVV